MRFYITSLGKLSNIFSLNHIKKIFTGKGMSIVIHQLDRAGRSDEVREIFRIEMIGEEDREEWFNIIENEQIDLLNMSEHLFHCL